MSGVIGPFAGQRKNVLPVKKEHYIDIANSFLSSKISNFTSLEDEYRQTEKQNTKDWDFSWKKLFIVFVFALSVRVMQHTHEMGRTTDDLCVPLFIFFILCNDPNKQRQLCLYFCGNRYLGTFSLVRRQGTRPHLKQSPLQYT
jgi:hypothetical protein